MEEGDIFNFNHPVSSLLWALERAYDVPPKPEPEKFKYQISDLEWAIRKETIERGKGVCSLTELCQVKILRELGANGAGSVFDSFPENVNVDFGRALAARMIKKQNYEFMRIGFEDAECWVYPKPFLINRYCDERNRIIFEYTGNKKIIVSSGIFPGN